MSKTARLTLLVGTLLLCGAEAYASIEPPDIFVEAYGSFGTEVARCVTPAQDGGFVVTGYFGGDTSGSIFLAKFDAEGTRLWRRSYSGGGNGEGRCVIETDDGHLVMVGYTLTDTAGETDFLLAKLDADGNKVWMQRWGGSRDDKAYGVIETQDGTLWAVGTTNSFTPWPYRTEVVLVKISAGGTSVTGARAGNPGLSRDYSGLALAEVFGTYPGICVTGSVSMAVGGEDILLAKFSHTPEFWWARRFGTFESAQDEVATSIVRTSDAGLALAGWASGPSGPMFARRGFLLKLDTDADYDWARRVSETSYGTPPPLVLRSVIETMDCHPGLAVVGGYPDSSDNAEVVLAKWTLDGSMAWWHTGFGDATGNVGYSIAEDADQSLLIVGATTGYGYGQTDLLLARCCSNGQTCIDGLDGPDFYGWTADQDDLAPSSDEFTAATTPWYHPVVGMYWYQTQVCATVIHTVCPGDPGTIQDAIDGASNGDIIELCDGTFTGPGNRDLDFHGKCLTVRSQSGNREACIIDCQQLGRGFYFHSGEGCHAIVESITISNGTEDDGGGIYCENASPRITDCKIEECDADDSGGGIYCYQSSPTIESCRIEECDAGYAGGGIYCEDASATIDDCEILDCSGGGIHCCWCWSASPTIVGCQVGWCAGPGIEAYACSPSINWCTIFCNDDEGVRLYFSEVEITQCTIADNALYGISVMYGSPTVQNSIIWGNGGSIYLYMTEDPPTSIACHCCDVEGGGCPGENNIDEDPQFCNPAYCDDYHLRKSSPCAAAQQPICGLIGALDVGCGCPMPGDDGWYCTADISPNNGDGVWNYHDDGDCIVGLDDLAQLLGNYGCTTGCTHEMGDVCPEDRDGIWEDGVDGDGVIDLADLAEMLGQYGDDCNWPQP